MKTKDTAALAKRKAKMDERLDPEWGPLTSEPVLGHANLGYEIASRVDAIPCGGIGLIHEFVRAIGLPGAIDQGLHLFKVHKPYFESDHVLNMVFNIMCGGTLPPPHGQRMATRIASRAARGDRPVTAPLQGAQAILPRTFGAFFGRFSRLTDIQADALPLMVEGLDTLHRRHPPVPRPGAGPVRDRPLVGRHPKVAAKSARGSADATRRWPTSHRGVAREARARRIRVR